MITKTIENYLDFFEKKQIVSNDEKGAWTMFSEDFVKEIKNEIENLNSEFDKNTFEKYLHRTLLFTSNIKKFQSDFLPNKLKNIEMAEDLLNDKAKNIINKYMEIFFEEYKITDKNNNTILSYYFQQLYIPIFFKWNLNDSQIYSNEITEFNKIIKIFEFKYYHNQHYYEFKSYIKTNIFEKNNKYKIFKVFNEMIEFCKSLNETKIDNSENKEGPTLSEQTNNPLNSENKEGTSLSEQTNNPMNYENKEGTTLSEHTNNPLNFENKEGNNLSEHTNNPLNSENKREPTLSELTILT